MYFEETDQQKDAANKLALEFDWNLKNVREIYMGKYFLHRVFLRSEKGKLRMNSL